MDCRIGTADNRSFADLAQGLIDNGIAPIRHDKRSYVYPEGVIDAQTECLYDVRDMVHFTLKEPRVNGSQLYLIGHN